MKAITFPEVNTSIAKDQEDYNTLPSYVGKVGEKKEEVGVVCCFELDDKEINRIRKYKKIWFRSLTFGFPLQPFNLFAVRDYFQYSEETVTPDKKVYQQTRMILIRLGFWKRLSFLWRGEIDIDIYLKIKGNEVEVEKVEQV